jgi:hypothetical protein
MGLDIVETFMAVEAAFGVEVPDAEAARMETVGSLFDYVRAHVATGQLGPGDGQPFAGPLWERYLDVVAEETGVRRDRLRPGAYWVRDLGLD